MENKSTMRKQMEIMYIQSTCDELRHNHKPRGLAIIALQHNKTPKYNINHNSPLTITKNKTTTT